MKTKCPHCQSLYEVEDDALGTAAQCLKCGNHFTVQSEPQGTILKPTTAQSVLVERTNKRDKKLFLIGLLALIPSFIIIIFANSNNSRFGVNFGFVCAIPAFLIILYAWSRSWWNNG